MDKKNYIYCWSKTVNTITKEISMEGLKTIIIDMTHDLAQPVLGNISKDSKLTYHRKTYTSIFLKNYL